MLFTVSTFQGPQTILLPFGFFQKLKKWNYVCSVNVSLTISVWELNPPLMMKVSTPEHKKVNKKYLPHKFRSFFLTQHFCLFLFFFLLSNTLSSTLSPSQTFYRAQIWALSPTPSSSLDPQTIWTGHETGIIGCIASKDAEAIYSELYTVTRFYARKRNIVYDGFTFTWSVRS